MPEPIIEPIEINAISDPGFSSKPVLNKNKQIPKLETKQRYANDINQNFKNILFIFQI